jgi:hypothetical protein
MNTKDCPLCGAKDAIPYHPPQQVTRVGRARVILPNINIGACLAYEGGGYDFSHAQECTKLVGVFDKELLLEYFVMDGHPRLRKSDTRTFEAYQQTLSECGFAIKYELLRNVTGWSVCMFIDSTICPESKHLATIAKNAEEAFDRLKHRLLCGEIFRHGSGEFQLQAIEDGTIVLAAPKITSQ